jgi:hypothetical protein
MFFIHKKDGCAIVISARDMTKAERKRHEKELGLDIPSGIVQGDWRVLGYA